VVQGWIDGVNPDHVRAQFPEEGDISSAPGLVCQGIREGTGPRAIRGDISLVRHAADQKLGAVLQEEAGALMEVRDGRAVRERLARTFITIGGRSAVTERAQRATPRAATELTVKDLITVGAGGTMDMVEGRW
jgi:hypothetical protein